MLGRIRNAYDEGPEWLRASIGGAASMMPPSIRFGPDYAATARLLRETEYANQDDLDAFALARLRSLLQLAESKVPYYRESFKRSGFSAEKLNSLDDLRRVPVLTRSIAYEQRDRLVPEGLSASAYRYQTTGGTSSGEPLGLYVSHQASASEWAFINSAWSRVGYTPSDWRAVLRGRNIKGREQGRLWERDYLTRAVYFSALDMTTENLRAYAEQMLKLKTPFIHAFPSSASVLVRHLKSQGVELPFLKAWLISSETLDQRSYIESMGARVFSWYGHTEKCVLAAECEHGNALHPFPQYGITELVGGDGDPIRDEGVRGHITGTGFINGASIFIRYVTDDTAQWLHDPCGCGRSGYRLDAVHGRSRTESLKGAKGAEISLALLNLHDSAFDAVERFRFVQNEIGKAELLIVPRRDYPPEASKDFYNLMAAKLTGEIELSMRVVDELAPKASGKYCYIESNVPMTGGPTARSAPEGECR